MGKIVIQEETGEVIAATDNGDYINVTKSGSVEYLNNYDTWEIKHFYKGNIDELKELNKGLTITEAGFILKIIPYINYADCLLIHSNGKDINQDSLIEITGLSRQTTYRTIKSLINKDVLYKGKNSKGNQYFVNPWLFIRGNVVNKVLKSMFKNYHIKVLNKKWKDL